MSALREQDYAFGLNPFHLSHNIKSVFAKRSAVKPTVCAAFLLAALSGPDYARAATPPLQTKLADHAKTNDHNLRVARLPSPNPGPAEAPCNYGIAQYQPPPPPPTPATLCDGTICVSLAAVAASIHQQLDCHVVGYAFFVGNSLTGAKGLFGAYGWARTTMNPPAAAFTTDTKMVIGSASKTLTALTALKVMGSNIDNPAYTYFPFTLPSGSIVKKITSRQFISHTSGVMQLDAGPMGQEDDAAVKSFFMQPIPNPNAAPDCAGPGINVQYPILATTSYCYSNANFSIMRDVLGRYAGSTSTNPQTLGDNYVGQVNTNVLNPVGVLGAGCKTSPTTSAGYTFGVNYPGTTFSDVTSSLTCGALGWTLSVKDYASVLLSLNAGDGKILNSCGLYNMVTDPSPSTPSGWDLTTDGQGHRWIEKNGETLDGSSAGAGEAMTSVGLYGGQSGCVASGHGTPVQGIVAVLFINSNIQGSDPDGLFADIIQAPGPLTLGGSLVVSGTGGAALESVHHVIVASTDASDTSQTLKVTGSLGGNPETETIKLNGQTPTEGPITFDTITGVAAVSGTYPTKGIITVGTGENRADLVLLNALQAATTPD